MFFSSALHATIRHSTFLSPGHWTRTLRPFTSATDQTLLATQLTSRGLIRLSGEDTHIFLQGLITNDIANLDNSPAIYAVLLNHQGRQLQDIIIYSRPTSTDPQQVLIECDFNLKHQLLKHLTLYRVKKKVVIADASAELTPHVVFSPINGTSGLDSGQKEDLILGHHRGICDPRLSQLGWRFLLKPNNKLELSSGSETDYRKLLYSLGVGEGPVDSPPGAAFPLESNADYLHGVSFHKGCYVGQELTARTHHTGVVRKRLMPFTLPPGTTFPPETDTTKLEIRNEGGKPVGKVRNIIENYGLALTRIEEALRATELKVDKVRVTVKKPAWWPIELSKVTQSLKGS